MTAVATTVTAEQTAQESMNRAVRQTNSTYSAEIAVGLANAQARLYAAKQDEVRNLQSVLDSAYFTDTEKAPAKQRLMELLSIA